MLHRCGQWNPLNVSMQREAADRSVSTLIDRLAATDTRLVRAAAAQVHRHSLQNQDFCLEVAFRGGVSLLFELIKQPCPPALKEDILEGLAKICGALLDGVYEPSKRAIARNAIEAGIVPVLLACAEVRSATHHELRRQALFALVMLIQMGNGVAEELSMADVASIARKLRPPSQYSKDQSPVLLVLSSLVEFDSGAHRDGSLATFAELRIIPLLAQHVVHGRDGGPHIAMQVLLLLAGCPMAVPHVIPAGSAVQDLTRRLLHYVCTSGDSQLDILGLLGNLSNVANDPRGAAAMAAGGGVELLVRIMALPLEPPTTRRAACTCCADLMYSYERKGAAAVTVLEAGGLLAAMRLLPDEAAMPAAAELIWMLVVANRSKAVTEVDASLAEAVVPLLSQPNCYALGLAWMSASC